MRLSQLTFLLISLLLSVSYAQDSQRSVQYNVQSGMLSNLTYYGMFDQNDFLWICQNYGLSRFDGTRFTNFTTDDGLPDNDIIYITEDSKGTIWAQPFQREPAFLKKNTFRFQNVMTIIHPDTVKKDQSYRVFALKNGKVGLVSNDGTIRIIQDDRLISSYYLNIPILYYNLFLYESTAGEIILISTLGKFIIDQDKKTIRKESCPRYSKIEYNEEWICLQSVIDGPKILCINIKTHEEIPINNIRSVHRIGIFKKGILINQDGANLSFFDFKTKQIKDFPAEVILSHAIENRSGTVQVLLTADNGIHVLNQASALEKRFPGRVPAFFYLRDNRVYVSDALGNVLNLPDEGQENISSGNFEAGIFSERVGGKDLVYGSMVIVSNPGELAYNAAKMMGVKSVSILNDSIRYIATRNGAFGFNNRNRQAKVLYLGRTTAISAGPNGSVFIGTIRGLIEITSDGRLVNWSETGKFKQIRITDLCFRNNVLWVGTSGEGLNAIYNGKAYKILSSKNGTSRDYIETIEESDNQQLYIGYTNGAQMLHYAFDGEKLKTLDLITLDIFNDEGIHNFFFHSGIIYGLSSHSLYQFDTRKRIPVRSLQIQLTRLLLDNTTQKVQSKIELNAGKYDIQIEFSTQNYQRLPIRYRYQVNKEGWKYLSAGSISLDNLGSGDYQIVIQVLNNYNRPSDSKVITISVAYPFYVQSWFLIGIGALLFTVAYLLIRYFTRRHYKKINDQLIQQSKLREMELIALKAQINPHFVFNCLNSIKGLIYQQRIQEADVYIDRFSQLFRNTLEASFEHDYPLSSEISYLTAYLEIEQMSMDYRFDFEIIVDPEINPDQIVIPAMLLQPHVENAVKHGVSALRDKKGLITVSFLKQENQLVCIVRDNGPGRVSSSKNYERQPHTGKGISITEKRTQLYEIDTAFIEHDSGGVSVILTFQITRKYD